MTGTDDEAASDAAIDVFLRIRPSKNPSTYFERDEIDDNKIRFNVPIDQSTVNNTRTHYGFEFNGVLDEKASQKDVFQAVGVPVTIGLIERSSITNSRSRLDEGHPVVTFSILRTYVPASRLLMARVLAVNPPGPDQSKV